MVPPYVRRCASLDAAIPWLYLHGVSTGQMRQAVAAPSPSTRSSGTCASSTIIFSLPSADDLWFLKTLSAAKTLLGSSPLLPRYQQTVRVQLTPIVASHRTALKTPGVISIRLKSVVSTDEQGRIVARPEASFGIGRNLPIARERP